MDNLEEMDRFLEKFNFPRLNQEEIEITKLPPEKSGQPRARRPQRAHPQAALL